MQNPLVSPLCLLLPNDLIYICQDFLTEKYCEKHHAIYFGQACQSIQYHALYGEAIYTRDERVENTIDWKDPNMKNKVAYKLMNNLDIEVIEYWKKMLFRGASMSTGFIINNAGDYCLQVSRKPGCRMRIEFSGKYPGYYLGYPGREYEFY